MNKHILLLIIASAITRPSLSMTKLDENYLAFRNAVLSYDYTALEEILRTKTIDTQDFTYFCENLLAVIVKTGYQRSGLLPKILQLLLTKGANVNAANDEQETLLYLAAGAGDASTCMALLRAGGNPLAETSAGVTPLDQAKQHLVLAKLTVDLLQNAALTQSAQRQ